MSREIKFRAWDKEFKRFSKNALEYAVKDIEYYTDYEWSQYTGLKDNKGREIYEGDIFPHPDNPKYKYVVAWDSETASFNWFCDETGFDHRDIEVIGNIYENPELIKEE